MTTRLETLQRFYDDDPDDPFNIYALALEFQKSDVGRAQELFDMLLKNHPDYIPTYYHAGKLYHNQGEKNKASEIFDEGIKRATLGRDLKAARELRSALDELMFE